jgi:hypothetical protein
VHVGEEQLGAAERELARAVEHLAFQQHPDPRPVVGERALPVARERVRERPQAAPRPLEQRPQDGRSAPAVEQTDLVPDLAGGHAPDRGELVLEVGQRGVRWRREEVGHVALGWGQRVQEAHVEALQRRAGLLHPRHVQRVR